MIQIRVTHSPPCASDMRGLKGCKITCKHADKQCEINLEETGAMGAFTGATNHKIEKGKIVLESSSFSLLFECFFLIDVS